MTARQRQLALAGDAASVTIGRHFVRDVLVAWGMPRLVDDAQLGASELIANAVRHARTDLRLTIVADRGSVRIAIEDGHPDLRRPVTPANDLLAENGRGLHIVATISEDWGVTATVSGKVIWFTLALPDRSTADATMLSMAGHRAGDRPGVQQAEFEAAGPERLESTT